LFLTFALNFKFDFPTLSLFLKNHDFFEALIVIANNVLIFGQSVLRFFFYDLDTGKFVFVDTYKNLIPIANKASFTMMIMSWTLDVELMFYLVAPFILMRSSSALLSIIFSSILLRLCWEMPDITSILGYTASFR